MNEILDSGHGTTVLLAGLVIILCLHLVLKMIEMAFETFKKKSETTDRLSQDFRDLNARLSAIERDMNEILKFRNDFRRLFAAVKALAGEKWGDIRKAITEDDISSGS